jgi:hypothetical protein
MIAESEEAEMSYNNDLSMAFDANREGHMAVTG